MESSWLYPVKQAMAVIQLIPIGTSLTVMKSTDLLDTRGFYGYNRIWHNVSNLILKLVELRPMACFPIALYRVFLGPWLWLAKGITEAHTPNIIEGCISQWVYRLNNSFPLFSLYRSMAMRDPSSSSTSSNSIHFLFRRSSHDWTSGVVP